MYLRQRIINQTIEVTPSVITFEKEFLMPDNSEAITGVMVRELCGIKSPYKFGKLHISNEQINGSFFTQTLVSFQNGNSVETSVGYKNNANEISYPRTAVFTPILVPVTGGDRIKMNFITDNGSLSAWIKGIFVVSFKFLQRELEK